MNLDLNLVLHTTFLVVGGVLLLFSFFTGTRFTSNDPFIPRFLFVVGTIGGFLSTIALSHGGDIILGGGLLFGLFLVGLATGMQLARRPD